MADIPSSFDIAVAAHQEYRNINLVIFQQPIEEHSEQINSVVYLRTSPNGCVARVDVRRHRILV